MDVAVALAEIEALNRGLDEACDALMTAAERGAALAGRDPVDHAGIAAAFAEIMTLCSFQDLAGQRLQRLAGQIAGPVRDLRRDAALLNGPANGGGLNQAAADAFFDDR